MDATEGEALTTGRNDGLRYVPHPDVGDRPRVGDRGIPAVSDPGADDTTTIVAGNVVGPQLRCGGPIAGSEVRPKALVHLACRVFQLRCRPIEFVEPRECGV